MDNKPERYEKRRHRLRTSSRQRQRQSLKSLSKLTMHAETETAMYEDAYIQTKRRQTVNKYFSQQSEEPFAQLKLITIKQFLSITINIHIITKVEANGTSNCKFLLFHICFLLSIAEVLCIYKNNQKYLFIYKLFQLEIQKINSLSKSKHAQLSESQCRDTIVCALRYPSQKGGKRCILQRLSNFLKKHELKMKGLMPCYLAYFKLVAEKQQLLSEQPKIEQVESLIETVQRSFQRYHNQQL